MQVARPILESEILPFVEAWFRALDFHYPLENCCEFLADKDLNIQFPGSDIKDFIDFEKWYDQVINLFFDENHYIKSVVITTNGEEAVLDIIVGWQASYWEPPVAKSKRLSLDATQRWKIRRSSKNKFRLEIVTYNATAEPFKYAPGFAQLGASKKPDIDQAVAAARTGDVKKLHAWLQAGGNPNQYDSEGWTPLLAASVRGQAGAVELLLNNSFISADPDIPQQQSGALAIHCAGHSGSVTTAEHLLNVRPQHLDEVWELNGHTLLLQSVFYNHLELAKFALERGANTAATTVRGLAAMELAQQFQNLSMMALLKPYDRPATEKNAYAQALLSRLAPPLPKPAEAAAQRLSDCLVRTIEQGITGVAAGTITITDIMQNVRELVEVQKADVNRLGGPLQQPPLVVVVTGNNGSPANLEVAALRRELAQYLLDNGALPTMKEVHPMGAHAIIRAAVFNHLDILMLMGSRMAPHDLANALNEKPVVNGLTALHDTVLRSETAAADRIDGYINQIRWCVKNGGRSDIEDFSGRTQREIAEHVADEDRRVLILKALGVESAETVFAHHLCALTQDVDEVMKDYDENAILLTPDGPIHGSKAIRAYFGNFLKNSEGLIKTLTFIRKDIKSNIVYTTWKAEPYVSYASDTIVIQGNKIVAHTFALLDAKS